jgi:hypothetical protein
VSGPISAFEIAGQASPKASQYSHIYFAQPPQDHEYYCYKSLFKSTSSSLLDAISDLQHLLQNDAGWAEKSQFTRTFVGGRNITLAHWLQSVSADAEINEKTVLPAAEIFNLGQAEYTFTLDVKPGIDLKYTLAANYLNPFVPEASGSLEQSSNFTVFLNAVAAPFALNAKTGNTCNEAGLIPPAKCPNKSP